MTTPTYRDLAEMHGIKIDKPAFIESRTELLQKLNSIMKNMNDERCYMAWILTVPDEATKEDFEDIAGDDEFFDEVLELFLRLFSWYKRTE